MVITIYFLSQGQISKITPFFKAFLLKFTPVNTYTFLQKQFQINTKNTLHLLFTCLSLNQNKKLSQKLSGIKKKKKILEIISIFSRSPTRNKPVSYRKLCSHSCSEPFNFFLPLIIAFLSNLTISQCKKTIFMNLGPMGGTWQGRKGGNWWSANGKKSLTGFVWLRACLTKYKSKSI